VIIYISILYLQKNQDVVNPKNPQFIFGYLSADRQACLPLPDGCVCRQAGRAVNAYKNAMQYKENYLQILMVMIIV